MNPNQELWEKGDFTAIAAWMRQSAGEMVRVTKQGGRIVMGNWIPNDPTSFVSQLLKISTAFTPPPPEGFISPMTWGVDPQVIERFGQAGVPKEKISMVKDSYKFAAPEKSGAAEDLRRQLVALAKAQNKSTGGGISITATFLRVEVDV